jgi:hypothetical protein
MPTEEGLQVLRQSKARGKNTSAQEGFSLKIVASAFSTANKTTSAARVNQQPSTHHPLDGHYDSVVDEPQLS